MGKKDNRGKGKVSQETESPLKGGHPVDLAQNHMQLWNALAVAEFGHGPQQRKQKKNH